MGDPEAVSVCMCACVHEVAMRVFLVCGCGVMSAVARYCASTRRVGVRRTVTKVVRPDPSSPTPSQSGRTVCLLASQQWTSLLTRAPRSAWRSLRRMRTCKVWANPQSIRLRVSVHFHSFSVSVL